MKAMTSFGLLLARICLSMVFLVAGVGKIFSYEETTQYMASKGMTMLPLMFAGALIVEVGVGLCLLGGLKTRLSAFILCLFVLSVTYIFHDFWNASPETYPLQLAMFLKNVGIVGGLIALVSVGGGCLSMDACCRCNKEPETPTSLQNGKVKN